VQHLHSQHLDLKTTVNIPPFAPNILLIALSFLGVQPKDIIIIVTLLKFTQWSILSDYIRCYSVFFFHLELEIVSKFMTKIFLLLLK
jgi:hypothetical protein